MIAQQLEHDEPLFINLTPMIDVILTLLIFFMAATKLYDWNEQKLDVQLPEVGAAKPITEAPAEIVLRVAQDGTVEYSGDVVTVSEMTARLRTARENYPDQAVVIRGDGRVPFRRVAEVMSGCEAAGISQIAVHVRETAAEPN
jgi:biopolymer transport protein ExbD